MQQFVSKSSLALVGISVLAFLATPAEALVIRNTAVITNTGSTNTIGYRIYLLPSGQATYVDGKGQRKGTISEQLTKKFFRDINAAQSLSELPVKKSCVKPVSFGTSTFLALDGQRSPDLSCYGNQKAHTLFKDINLIAQKFHVKNVPRSQGQELPPQNF
jgi:hypothetical protein